MSSSTLTGTNIIDTVFNGSSIIINKGTTTGMGLTFTNDYASTKSLQTQINEKAANTYVNSEFVKRSGSDMTGPLGIAGPFDAKLVLGDGGFGTNIIEYIDDSGQTRGALGFTSNTSGEMAIVCQNDDIVLSAGTNDTVYVKPNGYVGIGTSTPDSTLHVVGDIHASDKVDTANLIATVAHIGTMNTQSVAIAGTTVLDGTTLGSCIVNSSLTSVGTLASLNVSGTASTGNLTVPNATITSSLVVGSVTSSSGYKVAGTTVLDGTTLGSGIVNSSLTSVGTLASLNVSGTASAGNLTVPNATITSSLVVGSVTSSSGYKVAGTTVLDGTTLGSGIVNSSLTSVGNLSSLNVVGTASAGNLTVPNATITSSLVVGSVTSSSGYKVAGTTVLDGTTLGSGIVNSSLTSVGTLASLNVSGTASAGNLTVPNATITSSLVVGSVTSSSGYKVAGTTVLDGTTLGSGIVNSSLTSVGNLSSLNVVGTASAGNLTVPNATITSSLVVGSVTSSSGYKVAGTTVLDGTTLGSGIVNSSLTSVGNLSSLNVVGTASAGNLTVPNATITSSLVVGSVTSSSGYKVAGTTVLDGTTLGSGIVNSSLTSVGNLSSLNVVGTASAGNLTVPNATITSSLVVGSVTSSSGYKVAGTTVLDGTTLGSGIVNSSLTSVGTLASLNVSGTASAGNLTVPNATITSSLVVGSVTSSSGYKVAGTTVLDGTTLGSGIVNSSLTSVGTLASLNVSGSVTMNSTVSAGSVTTTGNITTNVINPSGSTLNIGTASGVTAINIGTNADATIINIGSPYDTVNIRGNLVYVDATNANIKDSYITLNKGGALASAGGAGIDIEENGVTTGFLQVSSDRSAFEFKAPGSLYKASIPTGLSANVVLATDTQISGLSGALGSANANIGLIVGNLAITNSYVNSHTSNIVGIYGNIVALQANTKELTANIGTTYGTLVSQISAKATTTQVTDLSGALGSANANIGLIVGNLAITNSYVNSHTSNIVGIYGNIVALQANTKELTANIGTTYGTLVSQISAKATTTQVTDLSGALGSANANIVGIYGNIVALQANTKELTANIGTTYGTLVSQISAKATTTQVTDLSGALGSANANIGLIVGNLAITNSYVNSHTSNIVGIYGNIVALQANTKELTANIGTTYGTLVSQISAKATTTQVTDLSGALGSANANIGLIVGNLAITNSYVNSHTSNIVGIYGNIVALQANTKELTANIGTTYGTLVSQISAKATTTQVTDLSGALGSANANIVGIYGNIVALQANTKELTANIGTTYGTLVSQISAKATTTQVTDLSGALGSANANIGLIVGNLAITNSYVNSHTSNIVGIYGNIVALQANTKELTANIGTTYGTLVSQISAKATTTQVTDLSGALGSANANIGLIVGNLAITNSYVNSHTSNIVGIYGNIVALQANTKELTANIGTTYGTLVSQISAKATTTQVTDLSGALGSANANIVGIYGNIVALQANTKELTANIGTTYGTLVSQISAKATTTQVTDLSGALGSANANIGLIVGNLAITNSYVNSHTSNIVGIYGNIVALQANTKELTANIGTTYGTLVSQISAKATTTQVTDLSGALGSANANIGLIVGNLAITNSYVNSHTSNIGLIVGNLAITNSYVNSHTSNIVGIYGNIVALQANTKELTANIGTTYGTLVSQISAKATTTQVTDLSGALGSANANIGLIVGNLAITNSYVNSHTSNIVGIYGNIVALQAKTNTSTLNSSYVQRSGSTMSGKLILNGPDTDAKLLLRGGNAADVVNAGSNMIEFEDIGGNIMAQIGFGTNLDEMRVIPAFGELLLGADALPFVRLTKEGNVGIGIDSNGYISANSMLHVAGKITAGNLTVPNATITSNLVVGSVTSSSLNVVGTASAGNLTVPNATITSSLVVGSVTSSSGYKVAGTTVLDGTTLGSGIVNSSLTSVGKLSNLNVSGPIITSNTVTAVSIITDIVNPYTSTLNIGTASGVTAINIGTNADATIINIGSPYDTVNIRGNLVYVDATNANIKDSYITLNKGGALASAGGAGIDIEENGVTTGFLQVSSDRSAFEFKAPGSLYKASIPTSLSANVVLATDTQISGLSGALGSANANIAIVNGVLAQHTANLSLVNGNLAIVNNSINYISGTQIVSLQNQINTLPTNSTLSGSYVSKTTGDTMAGPLTIHRSSSGGEVFDSSPSIPLIINDDSNTTNSGGIVLFGKTNAGATAGIRSWAQPSQSFGSLIFGTRSSDASAITYKVGIDNDGMLRVCNSDVLSLTNRTGGVRNTTGNIQYPGVISLGGGYGPLIRSSYRIDHWSDTLDLELCVNMSINNTNIQPALKVSAISGQVNISNTLQIGSVTGDGLYTTGIGYIRGVPTGSASRPYSGGLAFDTFSYSGQYTSMERMRIDGVYGYVGIGTTTPSTMLDVNGDVNYTGELRRNGFPTGRTVAMGTIAWNSLQQVWYISSAYQSWGISGVITVGPTNFHIVLSSVYTVPYPIPMLSINVSGFTLGKVQGFMNGGSVGNFFDVLLSQQPGLTFSSGDCVYFEARS